MKSGWLPWFLAGVAAAAVAVGVGELVGGLLGGTSIVAAIGALVIALQPPGGKDLMTQLFGTNDKAALEIMVTAGGLLVGGVLGLAARRDVRIATAGFVAFGAVAFILLMGDPLNMLPSSAIVAVVATAAGLMTLSWLTGAINRYSANTNAATNVGRRGFVALAALLVVGGSGLAVVGRLLGAQVGGSSSGPPGPVPTPGQTAGPVLAAADFSTDQAVAGVSPIVVPNADFYRIDTRLSTPRIDSKTWSLRVHGMVDRELTLTYDQLLARPLVERYVTIACVSNEVGGPLVGNAKWTGTSLVDLLNEAGIKQGATQVVPRSFDGWTAGFPTEHLSGAGSDAMVVVAMNGEPLPPQHGFPARLIVPGLFGYVSATKWLTEIELTTLEAFDAYWVPLGWSKLGPILTQSRIDRPVYGALVNGGNYEVAGVAWAPTRGISKVEVRLDTGDWQQAQLSQPLSNYSWVQWRAALNIDPGAHAVTVRATDGTGTTQPEGRTSPPPDGARGWHQVQFSAR
ncbi:MAG TPA: molybdopterin-dependent oxidoreductase [Candidatus Limnocylindria bacterium]|nr:molybdopterin-dependent oxidoreductase [Candidatus Limnocylindria bacterium]